MHTDDNHQLQYTKISKNTTSIRCIGVLRKWKMIKMFDSKLTFERINTSNRVHVYNLVAYLQAFNIHLGKPISEMLP